MPKPQRLRKPQSAARGLPSRMGCGDVAEWSKALAWKVSIRQKRIEGSNPSVSASFVRADRIIGQRQFQPFVARHCKI
jgi:hypothetical protein